MKNSKGFTLIEVLIVVGIIGILAAIAIPSYINWLPNYRLRGAARDLYGAAMKAKGEAVKRNVNCALTFNQGGNVYIVFVDTNGNSEFDVGEALITQVQQWPNQVNLGAVTFINNDNGNPTIAFRPSAIPTDNNGGLANGTATLTNTNGLIRNIVINRAGSMQIN